MPRAARPVDVASIEDLDVGMGTPAGGWRLYNARSEWFQATYNAVPYYLPPDLGGEMDDHPVQDTKDRTPAQVICDGILKVDDRIGWNYMTTASGGPSSKRTGTKRVYDSARDVVRAIVRMYGDRGITFLTGDEKSDAVRKDMARKAYLDKQVEHDLYLCSTWDEQMQAWRKRPQNQGQPLPTPPEPVRLARERLDLRDATRRGLKQTFKYNCTLCGSYASNDESKFSLHMAVNHGQGEVKADLRTPQEAPAPKRRGRPRAEARA